MVGAERKKMFWNEHFLSSGEVFLYEREAIAKRSEFRKRVTEAPLANVMSLQARRQTESDYHIKKARDKPEHNGRG